MVPYRAPRNCCALSDGDSGGEGLINSAMTTPPSTVEFPESLRTNSSQFGLTGTVRWLIEECLIYPRAITLLLELLRSRVPLEGPAEFALNGGVPVQCPFRLHCCLGASMDQWLVPGWSRSSSVSSWEWPLPSVALRTYMRVLVLFASLSVFPSGS